MIIRSRYRDKVVDLQIAEMFVQSMLSGRMILGSLNAGNGNMKHYYVDFSLRDQRELRDKINANLGSIAGVELKTVAAG